MNQNGGNVMYQASKEELGQALRGCCDFDPEGLSRQDMQDQIRIEWLDACQYHHFDGSLQEFYQYLIDNNIYG